VGIVVITLVLGVLSSVLADELKAWTPRIVAHLIDFATQRLPQDLRARYHEEWTSHVNDVPGEARVLVAMEFILAALRIRMSHESKKAHSVKRRAYSVKHRTISWVSKNLFDDVTYTIRNGLNKGLRRRGGLGWVPFESSSTPEFQFWKGLDLRGQVVYDIGAFHGLLTLYFASSAKQVTAWEPNSHNRLRLEENLRLNSLSNVVVRPYGLSSRSMQAQMSFDSLEPGTSSIDTGMARGGEQETVEVRTLDEEGLDRPGLIKIDVEGFELEVLKGASRTLTAAGRRPRLFLEMHGVDQADKRARVRAIVEHLWGLDYRDILHVESRTRITPDNAEIAAQGHLYVQAGQSNCSRA